jgi:hypothetical protein
MLMVTVISTPPAFFAGIPVGLSFIVIVLDFAVTLPPHWFITIVPPVGGVIVPVVPAVTVTYQGTRKYLSSRAVIRYVSSI